MFEANIGMKNTLPLSAFAATFDKKIELPQTNAFLIPPPPPAANLVGKYRAIARGVAGSKSASVLLPLMTKRDIIQRHAGYAAKALISFKINTTNKLKNHEPIHTAAFNRRALQWICARSSEGVL